MARTDPLESSIESTFVKKARALGCMTRKLNGMGQRDWPDQLVLIPGGVGILIEFKRPGESLRVGQQTWQEDAKEIGHGSYVFNNWQEPLELIKRLIK